MLQWAVAAFLLLLSPSYAQNSPIVDLGYAQYQGTFDGNLTSFKGMHFAAPPVGSLRWQPPQPPLNQTGVQNASALGPGCMQSPEDGQAPTNIFTGVGVPTLNFTPATITPANSEDCLLVTVYTPGLLNPENITELLPVVFWIHGGGYIAGSGVDPGNDLVKESGFGIVAVVIQYRLGIFGFLGGQAVKDGGALNAGLLDQHFALQWTQQHVSKFGGDPTRVTIWGESAGAGSVLQHVVANDGATSPPLFRSAITSSTFLPSQYHYNDPIPEQLYAVVTTSAGCSSSSDSLNCLRQVDIATLEGINAAINHAGFSGTFVTVPVVDGTFIKSRPTEVLRSGTVNGNALLAVTNTDEGGPFVNQSTTATVTEYIEQLFPKMDEVSVNLAAKLYNTTIGGSTIQQINAIMNDSIFVCPSFYLLEAFNVAGKTAFKGDYAVPVATHGADIFYYFPSLGTPAFTNPDFDAAFSESFTAFIATSDPNETFQPTITPQWAQYAIAGSRTEMLFNKTVAGEPQIIPYTTHPDLLERCAFWNALGIENGQ